MIVAGLGIGPLPLHVARRDVADGVLWRLPPYETPPAIDVFLLVNPEKIVNRAEKALITGIQTAIAEWLAQLRPPNGLRVAVDIDPQSFL